ncbi:hypothetical protein [Kribbella sp. NPDC055071]
MVIAVGIAVLACAGCSGDPESGDAKAPATTPAGGSTTSAPPPSTKPSPKPTVKPTPVALTVPLYQRAMTNVDKTLKPYVTRVMKAQTVAQFDYQRSQLAKAVVLEQGLLAKITPPRGLVGAHPAVLDAFDGYAGDVSANLSAVGSTKTSCNLPKPLDVRLYQAKAGVRTAYVALAQSVQKSVGKGVKFGALSVPPALAAPAVLNGRGTNGDVIQRSGARGPGTLKISNAGGDVVIVVTNSSPRTPQASIYVRSNKSATLSGIRGDYWVYFKGGSSWDAANRRFTEDCSYQKYDDRFDGSYDWTISLTKTPFGNAPTSDTDAF